MTRAISTFSLSRIAMLGAFLVVSVQAVWASDDPTRPRPSLEVEVPRIEGVEVTVDGVLDEEVWARATRFSGFSDYLPVDGRLSQDSTVVLVWYSPTAIHFGIKAYEMHGEVRATLADRDRLGGDDNVQIILDTYNDRRQAFTIGVNPFGQQADGTLKDSDGGGRGSNAPYTIDLSPDFLYQSKGRLTEYGFEVEVVVPFKSVRYQNVETQDWGFNIIRQIQHSGYTSTWTSTRQNNASFMSQNGVIPALTNLQRGLVLDINPEVTGTMNRPAGNEAKFDAEARDPLGLNVRWGITSNLTLNGTVNPDFSQVEADVAQISFDPRQAVFVPEKRPFFLDGIELFQSPTNLIYSRRVSNPLSAVKLTGKIGSTNIAALSAVDNRELYLSDLDAGYMNAVRFRRDLSGQNTIGLVLTDKSHGGHWNRVAAVDGRMTFASIYSMTYQAGMSFTGDPGTAANRGEMVSAPMWKFSAIASGRKYGGNLSAFGFHNDFNAESGFITRTGIVNVHFQPYQRWTGDEGAVVESLQLGFSLDGTWDYDRFTDGKTPNDQKFHLNSAYSFKGGWSGTTSVFLESFKYPEYLYTNFYLERKENGVVVDTTAYIGEDRLTNLGFWTNLTTPQLSNFSGNLQLVGGRDDNFSEWSSSNILFITLGLNYTPTEQIRINFSYNHQQYDRASDHSTVSIHRVPRLKAEYQVTPSLFIRLVGQYDSNFVDALRDDSRTEEPILILNPSTGVYSKSTAFRRNTFRVDWLVSFRPDPGTVLFVGYGNSSREPNTYRFRDLQRTNDGFFLKLSYLFRV
ncbi:MAG: DUF5916 domain-containing protein [Bacteroidetes bacterium]|nr:DUF5916 domain-containing protein [Bacteroidota bacterium]